MKTLILSIIAISALLFIDFSSAHESDFFYSHYSERYFVPPIDYTAKDLRCLTQAIYYESNNQPSLGKEAVATVIVNRFYSGKYPKSICRIVYQSTIKDEKKICQFSFTCYPIKKPNYKGWVEAEEIAKRVLQNRYNHVILRELNKALYFHADYVKPTWSQNKVFVKQIGQHLFYQERVKRS